MKRAEGPAVAVDVSRLVTGLRYKAPTGVERWELGYASLLAPGPGVILSPIGPRALSPPARARVVSAARRAWQEDLSANTAAELDPVMRFLGGEAVTARQGPMQRAWRAGGLLPHFARAAFSLPALTLPRGAAYVHANFFRLERPGYFEWLVRRPDIKPVFVIYDLLPISDPQFFRPGEAELHTRRIDTAMRKGRAIVVPCSTVAEILGEHAKRQGLPDTPVHVLHSPVEAAFTHPPARNEPRDTPPYFVICGTIEPRKNHRLLLDVWRRLVAAQGRAAPKLVIVGRRGWQNDAVFAELDRLGPLAPFILEAGTPSTAALSALIAGARGLLSPSLAEGYGIPVAEALALGTPVLASDNPVYRELWADKTRLLPAADADAWAASIDELAAHPTRNLPQVPMDWARHVELLQAVIAAA